MDNTSVVKETNDIAKWSWACRVLIDDQFFLDTNAYNKPEVGDLVLVQVEQIGKHNSIMAVDNKRLRIYENDLIVGVFGNRYATAAFEGQVESTNDLCILTAGGMIGTLKSKHREVAKPTNVLFNGFLTDSRGNRINLKKLRFGRKVPAIDPPNLIAIVGTGMNSGKTTASSRLIKALSIKGLKVSACKVTGSVSNRDQDEMRSASARLTIDFSDYGFPSTYLCTKKELMELFDNMIFDAMKINPAVIIMEIADGVLQRETAMMLSEPAIKRKIKGIVLTAESAPSALFATHYLEKLGYKIIAVSGAITSSPLSVQEFKENSDIPIASSAFSGVELEKAVTNFIDSKITVST